MTSTLPAVGDTTFLQSYLINTRVYGVVVPPGEPPEFTATFEIQGDQGTLTMAVVIGPQGPSGQNMFALLLQTDDLDDPADLPKTLTDTEADRGKYWMFDDVDATGEIIGSSMYIWYGHSYRRMMVGSPGPPGPVPIITPSVELIPEHMISSVDEGGTPWEPTMHFNLAVPKGPQGPAPALAVCPDVDLNTNSPVPGDILGFTGRRTPTTNYAIWEPVAISALIPGPFSMPEAAFTSFTGVTSRAAIGSFAIPPQPFPWTPVVWGHIAAFGLEISLDFTQMIGCEVRLGDPVAGEQIARGFGNTLGEVNIMPHYSDPNAPNKAITPTNGIATVPANHSNPAEATLYVNLYNDGDLGLYQFSPTDAQIFVLLMPVGG